MSPKVWQRHWDDSLEARRRAGLLRSDKPLVAIDALHAKIEGRSCALFSTNDYLGAGLEPSVLEAWRSGAGAGPRGSARVCGYTDEHQALEGALARHLGKEACVLFPTGYAANLSVMAALCSEGVDVISDALNHASIIDGLRLGKKDGARVHIIAHNDLDALEDALRAAAGRRVIVTEGIFSMEGSLAPLREIAWLADRYDALLAVDEAHSSLTLGPEGAGAAAEAGVLERVDLVIGTLSKSFASMGGYVAGGQAAVSWIKNRGRAGIYSTALPIPCVRAARAALTFATSSAGEVARGRLHEHIESMAEFGNPRTAIVPIHLGSPDAALRASSLLLERGLHAVAIRPPTVPEGSSRLRVSLSAAHTSGEVAALREALRAARG